MARPPKLLDEITVEFVRDGVRMTRKITRMEAVLEMVRQGVTHKVAAIRAGISESTFYAWRDKGRKATRKTAYRDFVEKLAEAEAVAEGTLVLQMRSHCAQPGAAGVRATMFMLERRFPERWRETKHVDTTVSTPSGAPPTLVVQVADLATQDLAALSGVNLDDMDELALPTDDPAPAKPAQETDQ